MNENSTKTIAILVVLAIVVVGIGVVLLYGVSGSSEYRSTNVTGRLTIFGNVNNDDYIDEKDLDILERIISGEESVDDRPLADADQDGSITQSDMDMVERMVDRESMEIFYLDPNGRICSVNYPVDNVVVVGTNILTAMKSIGGVEKMLGISGGDRDPVLFSDVIDLPLVSDNTFDADSELVSMIDGVQAIITQDSSAYLENEDVFTEAGIDVVRVAASNGLETISGIITLGYLLDLEDNANRYARFCDETLAFIESKVGDGALADSERVTCLSVTMSNYVGGTISDYYEATEMAGAINLADWDTTTQRFNIGDEWLYAYDPDYIIHVRSIGYEGIDDQSIWDKYSIYFTEMGAYQDGNYMILNGNMPVVIRIAYMAAIFYPDIFGEDYGEKAHQEFIDNFMDNLNEAGYDVTVDGTFLITPDMVGS
jgi:iron complex transport system substrate-binding protein